MQQPDKSKKSKEPTRLVIPAAQDETDKNLKTEDSLMVSTGDLQTNNDKEVQL